jgi:hypothetical protein
VSDPKDNRRALRVAATRYYNKQSEERFAAVESAFAAIQFDRMDVETEPAAESEQPALELDSESAEE